MKKEYIHKQISFTEALKRAKEYGLTKEIKNEIKNGATPWEALYEWDLLDFNEF